ncbi:hypothetical protein SAJA_06580 [Salinisphaera japonica YTM-1]|uniref:Uncharacterized protein n=1 Tax=Salinisphaera japonica YTM-1 TaxID=1209778 RepID=A0A423PUQ1_9GAMM|nr:hypothetical protein SAJA_06580 [Salinisphaera japonica YTM-1]
MMRFSRPAVFGLSAFFMRGDIFDQPTITDSNDAQRH